MSDVIWIAGLTILAVCPFMTKFMIEEAVHRPAELAKYGLTAPERSKTQSMFEWFIAIVVLDVAIPAILAAVWYGLFSMLHNQMNVNVTLAIIAVPVVALLLGLFLRLLTNGEL